MKKYKALIFDKNEIDGIIITVSAENEELARKIAFEQKNKDLNIKNIVISELI